MLRGLHCRRGREPAILQSAGLAEGCKGFGHFIELGAARRAVEMTGKLSGHELTVTG